MGFLVSSACAAGPQRHAGVGTRFLPIGAGADWCGSASKGEVSVLAEKSDRKPGRRPPAAKADDAAMGAALRSVYQKTVEERVPDEFLDLLGKLD